MFSFCVCVCVCFFFFQFMTNYMYFIVCIGCEPNNTQGVLGVHNFQMECTMVTLLRQKIVTEVKHSWSFHSVHTCNPQNYSCEVPCEVLPMTHNGTYMYKSPLYNEKNVNRPLKVVASLPPPVCSSHHLPLPCSRKDN